MNKNLVTFKGFEVTEIGLNIPPGTTKEKWAELATKVANVGQGYWWWVGDLANYARQNFGTDKQIEESIQELANICGSSRKHIVTIADTARAYAVKHRISHLSISHHMYAARVPLRRRQMLLNRALKQCWPVRRMMQAVLKDKTKRTSKIILRVPTRIANSARFKKGSQRVLLHLESNQ